MYLCAVKYIKSNNKMKTYTKQNGKANFSIVFGDKVKTKIKKVFKKSARQESKLLLESEIVENLFDKN